MELELELVVHSNVREGDREILLHSTQAASSSL